MHILLPDGVEIGVGLFHGGALLGAEQADLAKRIDAAEPVLVICASCGIEAGRVLAYKPLLDALLGEIVADGLVSA